MSAWAAALLVDLAHENGIVASNARCGYCQARWRPGFGEDGEGTMWCSESCETEGRWYRRLAEYEEPTRAFNGRA